MSQDWSNLDRWIARHEAAHAVVAVRLGLPLLSASIYDWRASQEKAGTVVAAGGAALEPGTLRRWREQLPDPIARERLVAGALVTAVGCIVAPPAGQTGGYDKDVSKMQWFARALGIGGLTFDPVLAGNPVEEAWLNELIEVAETVLLSRDDGRAWDRVTDELERQQLLSGDEVLALVGASDAANGQPPWSLTSDEAWQLERQRAGCQCEDCRAKRSG